MWGNIKNWYALQPGPKRFGLIVVFAEIAGRPVGVAFDFAVEKIIEHYSADPKFAQAVGAVMSAIEWALSWVNSPFFTGMAAMAAIFILWSPARKALSNLKTRMFSSFKSNGGNGTLRAVFDATDSGCVKPDVTMLRDGRHWFDCTYYRVKVSNFSNGAIKSCQGRMTAIKKNAGWLMREENLILPFAPAESVDAINKTLYPGASEHLDFLLTPYVGGNPWIVTAGFKMPSSFGWQTMFDEPAVFVFFIEIVGDTTIPAKVEIEFDWTGDYRSSKMRQIA